MTKLFEITYTEEDIEKSIGGSYTNKKLVEEIVSTLKSDGIYEPDLLFRAFSSDGIKRVLETGTDRNNESSNWFYNTDINPQNILFAIPGNAYGVKNSGLDYLLHFGFRNAKKGLIAMVTGREGEFATSVYRNDLTHLQTISDPHTYFKPDNVRPVAVLKVKKVKKKKAQGRL